MFEMSEANAAKLDRLVELCRPIAPGGYLTHEAIEEVLGVPRHAGPWQHFVTLLRRRLEDERGVSIWCERLVGYELLKPERQLLVPQWRGKRAMRQLRKGIRAVDKLPATGLTAHQKRVRSMRLEKARDAAKALRRHLRELAVISKPSETMPRPRARTAGVA
jgi:hypothetical protein